VTFLTFSNYTVLSEFCQVAFSNSKFNKLPGKFPLRDAQRYASAGPGSKKGQAFGLASFAATRAHSVFLRVGRFTALVGEFQ
jgi:hypothetical protein